MIRWTLMLTLALTCAAHAADRVPIKFNLPGNLDGYTGKQPVTFGVPFPPGRLAVSDGVRVVDSAGNAVPCQFEVTGTWTADAKHVRWLLVDCFADIENGNPAPRFIEFGPDVKAPDQPSAFTVSGTTVDTGARQFDFGRTGGNFGVFEINTGDKREYRTAYEMNFELERDGPVRAVVKLTGRYLDAKGGSIAEYVTRIRLYAGQPYARAYHTMVWLTGDETTIADLQFLVGESTDGATPLAGVDGERVYPNQAGNLDVHQYHWDQVEGQARGQRLDGWMAAGDVFAAVRWPWQQYPLGLAGYGGRIVISLMDPPPAEPFSFKPTDVAVEPVMHNIESWDLTVFKKGVPGNDTVALDHAALPHLSPRGVAKTWEMLLWYGDDGIAPEVKNTLAQEPVLACADPAFAMQASLPSPMTAYDAESFPQIEKALQRSFDHITREQGDYGDFGTYNFGDLQWNWTHSGVPIYRYWMNNGKGWSPTPWALWLRSGDRRYWRHGMVNSRHVMDVDTCHVNNVIRDLETNKVRGGQYHYSAIHWGYGPQHFSFYIDTEYLPLCWHVTGYERARDVMNEYVEGLKHWEGREGWMAHFHEDPKKNSGRHLTTMIKNLGAIYEATWDADVKQLMDEVVELVLASQLESGNFPHVKTNHYTDQTLAIGERIYGWEKFGEAITRWHTHLGDTARPGASGCVAGPQSVWLAKLVYDHDNDRHWAEAAAAMTMSQADAVACDGGDWEGFSAMAVHEAGPILRDWPIAMALMKQAGITEASAPRRPVAGFYSRIAVPEAQQREGWSKLRHVMLVLDENDGDVQVDFTFRSTTYHVRAIAPDGAVVVDEERTYEVPRIAFEGELQSVTLPSDGKKGVYAIEIDIAGRDEHMTPLHATSSTGKLVHLMPEGQLGIMASRDASRFYLKAQPGRTLEVSWPVGFVVTGRNALSDADGNVVAETHITQETTPRPVRVMRLFATGLPWALPLRYDVPAGDDTLYAVDLAHRGDYHRWTELKNNRPYVSGQRGQWFDPETYPHPDLGTYLDH